jgi:transcriptional regulator with XRE-family HTH domain
MAMATVGTWSGRETRALREALRMSVRNFAAHLGVNERTITKWESGGSAVRPRPELQAALDTALERASDDGVARFEAARQPAPVPIDLQTLPALGRDTTFPELCDVISVAAAESTKFLMWAEMENI